MSSATGLGLFVYLTDQSIFLKNVENDNGRNIIRGALRFIVASIALPIFVRLGLYYNLVLSLGKAILGTLYKKRIYKEFKKESEKNLREAKIHLVKVVLDLTIMMFKSLAVILYAISPNHVVNIQNKLERKLINQNATK